MKLKEKRKVIEVLLCARNQIDRRIMDLVLDRGLRNKAYEMFEDVFSEIGEHLIYDDEYWHTATEAAYRLIESSPVLRREWFNSK